MQGELTYDSTNRKIPKTSSSKTEIDKLKKLRKKETSFLQINSVVVNEKKQWYVLFYLNLPFLGD